MTYPASSQENFPKPSLFHQLPDKAKCSAASLEGLFTGTKQVSLSLNTGIHIRGEIMTKVFQSSSVQRINIKLMDFPGGIFSLSRISLEDGSVRYSGRMFSRDYGDMMVLVSDNGNYYFIKTTRQLVMTE